MFCLQEDGGPGFDVVPGPVAGEVEDDFKVDLVEGAGGDGDGEVGGEPGECGTVGVGVEGYAFERNFHDAALMDMLAAVQSTEVLEGGSLLGW